MTQTRAQTAGDDDLQALVQVVVTWLQTPSAAEQEVQAVLGGFPATIIKEEGPALIVLDHLGIEVFHMAQGEIGAAPYYSIAAIKEMFENLIKGSVLFQ